MSELRQWQWKRPADGLILGRPIQSYKGVAFVRRLAEVSEGGSPERVPGYACSFLSDWEYAPTTPALTAAAWPGTEPARRTDRIPAPDVHLPGPSPRDLACTCSAPLTMDLYPRTAEPGRHHVTCPVAPVPGVHGGMRLLPVPFRGQPWEWTGWAWQCGHGRQAITMDCNGVEVAVKGWHAPDGLNDVILQCFYLPPEPQPEPSMRTPWDPYGTDIDLAVPYG